jgi:hypothetical protein
MGSDYEGDSGNELEDKKMSAHILQENNNN